VFFFFFFFFFFVFFFFFFFFFFFLLLLLSLSLCTGVLNSEPHTCYAGTLPLEPFLPYSLDYRCEPLGSSLLSLFESSSSLFVAQASELVILLPQFPECWDYRHGLPYQTYIKLFLGRKEQSI
jgi:hypothetical protein